MKPQQLKVLGYGLIVVFVLNILLFSFRIISPGPFWLVLIFGAVFVYWVLPKMKKE
ncbi:hypothetical protein HYT55_04760 [Candidatus Woesearchaeota archaeon]|nr:hypothetical protein [Candidatus Woesearchaeota archaeon]